MCKIIRLPEAMTRLMIDSLDLVTRLHNEDLLCSDHYLDWALRRLETSDTQPTLIPLLVIQNLGRPSSESAGFGQRLASACVLQLHKVSIESPFDRRESRLTQLLAITVQR